ncbi:MAG: DUF1501 domain-containing protein [Kofleriaceae bacterium]
MNRRDLLKYAGLAGAATMLAPPFLAKAGPRAATKKRLIVVFAQGGWDPTYGIDPKMRSAFIDVPEGGRIANVGELDFYTNEDPEDQVAGFFMKHASVTAIVRGISVGAVSHTECRQRICTGTASETNPDMAAIVAHTNGNDLPMPYLILGDTAFAGEYAVSTGRVGQSNQIVALLDPAQAYPSGGRPAMAISDAEQAILTRHANATADRMRATRGSQGYNRKRVDDFVASIDRSKQLKSVREGLGKRGGTLALADQIALALDAMERDITQAVMIDSRQDWDTHNKNIDQAQNHQDTFSALTKLLDGLVTRPGREAGTKMIDDTIVVCMSELGRTPKLNGDQGKDHWPVTSAMVMGGGVDGGRVFGGTSDRVDALPVDLATGAVDPAGTLLTHDRFVGGILKLAGADVPTNFGGIEVLDALGA